MLRQQLEPVVKSAAPQSHGLRKVLVGFGLLLGILFSILIVVVVTNSFENVKQEDPLVTDKEDPPGEWDHKITEMRETEEFILSLGPHIARLKYSVLNLELPDRFGRRLFSEELEYNDLSAGGEKKKTDEQKSFAAKRFDWSIASSISTNDPGSLSLWQPFLKDVDYFEHAKFYLIRAKKTGDEHRIRWQADMGFQGLAQMKNGQLAWIHGSIDSQWRPDENVDIRKNSESPQLLTKFILKEFHTWEIPQTMFSEVLDAVLPDEKALKHVRRSRQEEYCIDRYTMGKNFKPPHEKFEHLSETRHPAVAVVDLDRDGFDDLYIMPQWGKNSFLRNRGDGTFEEIAEDLGLAIENHCSSAAFADFDNDGDYDLFLGRTLKPSMYLQNDGGKFHEKPLKALSPRPGLVSSISVADYNRDGLLDVFIANYYPFDDPNDAHKFLEQDDFDRFFKIYKQKKHQVTLNRIGPPNRLLVNRGGGRFGIAPGSDNLRLWRNSYQATWADYDGDGDPDLYVANDFAPNNFFRNDDGKFVDITEETGTSDIGFGMGASSGDYDNDGKQDLYISNMYSKAGRRITEMIPHLDSRIAQMARGNSLFRNLGPNHKFEKVSGLDHSKLQVEMAGWSWSGQFADFDNDGHLDIYALSGHFSLPKVVELQWGEEGADL